MKHTDWDRHYIRGTLRRAPVESTERTDALARWVGRAFGLMAMAGVAIWLIENFK